MIRFWIICIAVSFAYSVYSQEASTNSFSLQAAQNYAIDNSYKVKISEKDFEMALSQMRSIRGMGLPQINGEVNFQNFIEIPTTLIPASVFNPMAPSDEFMEAQFGTEYNTTAQLSASQLIFDGSYFVGLKAAKAYVELSKLGLDKKTLETKESIASVYYNALVMEERQKLVAENISSTQLQIKEFSALVDAGFREQLDLDQMELRLTNLETAKQQIERSTELIYQLLKMFMGMPVEEELLLTDNLNEAIATINYNDLEGVKYGSANDIDFKQISLNGDLMKLNWKKEKMTLLPQVSAFFSYQQASMGNELTFDTWYPTTLWGVSARIPIFGGGSKYYRIQENKLAYEKAQLQMEDADRMLTQNAIDVRSNFMTAYESYTNTKKALEISSKIKDRTYTKYQEGISSSFEYNQALNQYLQAQETYISSVTQLLDAKTKFDKAYNNY